MLVACFRKNGYALKKVAKFATNANKKLPQKPTNPHTKSTTRVGREGGPGAGMEASGHVGGDRRYPMTRMPRGRCLPPVTPVPNPKRGEMMKRNSAMQMSSRIKDQSRIVVFSNAGEAAMKPMSNWKRGYVGFERKVSFVLRCCCFDTIAIYADKLYCCKSLVLP